MDRALRCRFVEQADELAVLFRRAVPVALTDGAFQLLEECLRGRAVAEVLDPLPGGTFDATLLLLDVGHAAADRTSETDPSGHFPMLAPVREPAPPSRERELGRRLAWSTAIFSIATGISRVLGLFREIVVRRYFGVQGEINAFTVAFQVPNLVRALAADMALGAAFVPVFSELLEKNERARAWRVASTLLWLVLIVLGALTALFVLIAPWIMGVFGLGEPLDDLAVTLSRLLFPIVVLMGVSGIVVGILNSYEQFSVLAVMLVLWN